MPQRFGPRLQATGVSVCAVCLAVSAFAQEPASVEADAFYRSLVVRYRGLTEYRDSVKLAHRTIERAADVQSATVERAIDCDVHGEMLAVRSSDVSAEAVRTAAPLQSECDSSDGSPSARIRLATHLWSLPHLSLRFAADPLRSMQGTGGLLVPIAVETVTIGSRSLLRLHLESDRAAPTEHEAKRRESSIDLFVNPRSMLVERVEESREIADGVRYEATMDIVPERAVPAPDKDASSSDDAPMIVPPTKDAPTSPQSAPTGGPTSCPPASVPSIG